MDTTTHRMLLRWLPRAGVSLALLLGVLWWVGAEAVFDTLRAADPMWLAAATAVFAVAACLHGIRWWVLLRPVCNVPLTAIVLILLAAKAVGAVVPLRAGAVFQVQVLGRRYGVDRAAVAGTLVLEAALDAGCFLLLLVIAAPLIGGGSYVTSGIWLMTVLLVAALCLLILTARRHEAQPVSSGSDILARIRRLVHSVRSGFLAVRSPRAVTIATVLTLSDWLLATVGFSLVGRSLGLGVAPADYLLVQVVSNLASVVPFTQSGIGPFEVAASQLLTARGAPADRAGAFALGAHALIIMARLALGGIGLAALRLRPSDVLYLRAGPRLSTSSPATTREDTARPASAE